VNGFPALNTNGEITEIVISFIDITERTKADEALIRSEKELKKAQQITHIGSWYLDVATNQVVWTEELYKMYGFNPALPPPPYTEHQKLFTPDSWELLSSSLANTRETGIPYEIELKTVREDGSNGWMWARGETVLNKEGQTVGLWGAAQDITERKQAEKSLKESEERFKNMFERHSSIMLLVDPESGMILNANDASARFYGYSKAELIAMRIDHINILSPEQVKTEREKAVREERSYFVFPHKLANGEVRTVEVHSSPIVFQDHKILFSIIHDITKRKQAEHELQLAMEIAEVNTANITAIIEGTANSIWAFNEQFEIVYINQVFKREFYQTFGVWLEPGTSLINSLPDVIRPFWKKCYDRVLNNEQFTVEDVVDAGNGIIYIQVTFNPIIKKGQVIGGSCFGSNITLRKLAEIELFKAKEHAEANEEKYRLSEIDLQEAQRLAHIGSWHWDLNTGLVAWSKELYKINGHNPDLPVPVFADMASFYTAESWKAINEAVAKTFSTGESYNLDFEMVKPDGTIIFTNTRGCANYNEAGEMINLHGTVQDISERKKTEEALIAAMEHAQQSDHLKSAFLANMSHEIRTPMNGILGFSALLKEPDLTGEDQQKYIRIIEKSGARMLNIINDIVDISKIEAGLMEVNLKESNINDQIEYIYTFFKPETEGKGMRLSFRNSLPEKEAIIITDREKIYAILTNLVKNAIKYTDGGSIDFGYDVVKTQHATSLQFFV
jgi:PAS domain S-box-containing protein